MTMIIDAEEAYLQTQVKEEIERSNELTIRRAEHANRVLQIRFLLELVDTVLRVREEHHSRISLSGYSTKLYDQLNCDNDCGTDEWGDEHSDDAHSEEHRLDECGGACWDVDDFFQRTCGRMTGDGVTRNGLTGDGVTRGGTVWDVMDIDGEIIAFDNEMVVKFVEMVVVQGDRLEVVFKAVGGEGVKLTMTMKRV